MSDEQPYAFALVKCPACQTFLKAKPSTPYDPIPRIPGHALLTTKTYLFAAANVNGPIFEECETSNQPIGIGDMYRVLNLIYEYARFLTDVGQ